MHLMNLLADGTDCLPISAIQINTLVSMGGSRTFLLMGDMTLDQSKQTVCISLACQFHLLVNHCYVVEYTMKPHIKCLS